MLIDVSMPITPGSVFRLGTPPVEIARCRFHNESEGEYETIMLSLPAFSVGAVDIGWWCCATGLFPLLSRYEDADGSAGTLTPRRPALTPIA